MTMWDRMWDRTYYFDSEYKQRDDINRTGDVAARAYDQSAAALAQLEKLQGQVHDLSTVVVTLIEQLAERDCVSPDRLREAVEAALAAARRDEQAERSADLAASANAWDAAGGPVAPKK